MPDEGRSLGSTISQAWRNSGRPEGPTSTSISRNDPTGITRVNRFAREFARVGSGYAASPNRKMLRGAARRGYRG